MRNKKNEGLGRAANVCAKNKFIFISNHSLVTHEEKGLFLSLPKEPR